LFSQKKHLKQGEKISNLENALQNLTHLPLTICKKNFEKDLQKNLQKQHVVQVWSKMLKTKKQSMHIL
jgi:aldehyde:ferredoxin oxidoreductase